MSLKALQIRVARNWEFFVVVGLPIILLPLLFIPDDDMIGEGQSQRPSTVSSEQFFVFIDLVY